MLIDGITKISKKINNSFIYREGEYYYIMNSDNIHDLILIEEKEEAVLLNYEMTGYTREALLDLILSNIDMNVIIPCVETKEEEQVLKGKGFIKTNYEDPIMDKELIRFPSYLLIKEQILENKKKEKLV